jgi:hypothetical protein
VILNAISGLLLRVHSLSNKQARVDDIDRMNLVHVFVELIFRRERLATLTIGSKTPQLSQH